MTKKILLYLYFHLYSFMLLALGMLKCVFHTYFHAKRERGGKYNL